MMAEKTMTEKVQELAQKYNFPTNRSGAQKLAEAHEAFNRLAARGLIAKKKLTLRSIDDLHLLQMRPNQPAY